MENLELVDLHVGQDNTRVFFKAVSQEGGEGDQMVEEVSSETDWSMMLLSSEGLLWGQDLLELELQMVLI